MNYYFKTIFIFCSFITLLFSCNEKKNMEEKYLNYQGHKIYYEVRGNSPKTLIFIHGWTGSIESWKYQLGSFGDYKVIAVDLPGNGKSSKDEKSIYSCELFADSVYQVLKNEKVDKGFFIGHSMGFAVCEVIAQKYPEICAGICSMDGSHFVLPENQKEKEAWIRYNRDFADTMSTEAGRENFLNMLFLPDTPAMLKDEVFKISRTVPLTIGRSMIEGVEKEQKFWMRRKSGIPLLAVYSPAYQLPPDYKNVLQKTYPEIEYHYIPGVSHFLMLEMPYKINQIIYNYLKNTIETSVPRLSSRRVQACLYPTGFVKNFSHSRLIHRIPCMRNRKPNRMPGYDYSLPGYYFVTINVHNRERVFGEIIDHHIVLNKYGEIARQCWDVIPDHNADCELDEYIVMPDHVHGIINIKYPRKVQAPPRRVQACLYPTGLRDEWTQKLPVIIGSYKSTVSKLIHCSGMKDFKWQKSYYDRIIRDRDELDAVREYIKENPSRCMPV